MLLSVPPELSESLGNSLVGQPVDQQAGSVLSPSKQLQTSSEWSKRESASRQKSLASSGFMSSQPQLGNLDPTEIQTAPLSASSEDLQTTSNAAFVAGQMEQAAFASGLGASDNSIPGSCTDHLEPAEISSMAENSGTQNFQSTSSITPAAGAKWDKLRYQARRRANL